MKTTKGDIMKYQTVEQRFHEQQMMKGKLKPKHDAQVELATPEVQNIQKTFNAIKQSLQEAHQLVRQAQAANPAQSALFMAEQSLAHATQLMQKLQTIEPEMTLPLPKGVQQQLKQLDYQIENASGTLKMIQQSLQTN